MLKKENGIGLCGGVSVQNESEIETYFNSCKQKIINKLPKQMLLEIMLGLKKKWFLVVKIEIINII